MRLRIGCREERAKVSMLLSWKALSKSTAKPLGRRRDGLGIWDTESIAIKATKNARFVLMEVPMQW